MSGNGGGDSDESSISPLLNKEDLLEKFGWEEYVGFAAMLLVSAAIGVYFWWRGQKTNAEFLMGGRQMGTLPMSLSLLASFISAITLLGIPSEVYRFGTMYCLICVSLPIQAWIVAKWILPVYYNLGVSTSYEYLEWRFNKSVRYLASACFILQMLLYMAIVVYVPALALAQVTGIKVMLACALIFVVCVFYTSIGGIKAVIWTDAFQTVVMFASFIAVIVKGTEDAGGAGRVFEHSYNTGRVEIFNFSLDPLIRHTTWSVVVGGVTLWLTVFGINQAMVQRYLTVPKMKMAEKAIAWSAVGMALISLLCGYAGLMVFSFYYEHQCDPIKSKMVSKQDQLFPLFVMQVFGDVPFIPGLFVAGVFSGALSTVSSGLNSLAAVTQQDFLHGIWGLKLSERASLWVSQGLAVVYGIVSFAVIFLIKNVPGVITAAVTIFGIISGPVLGGFLLGMFVPFSNSLGAFSGIVVSICVSAWMGFGQMLARGAGYYTTPDRPTTTTRCPSSSSLNSSSTTTTTSTTTTVLPMEETQESESEGHLSSDWYKVSYMWFGLVSIVICLIIGSLVSLARKPQNTKKLNPQLISPGLKQLLSWCPAKVRRAVDDIGAEFVAGAKERELLDQQILSNPDAGSQGRTVEDSSPPAYPEVERGGKTNKAFDVTSL